MSGVLDICLHNIYLGKKKKNYCMEKTKKTTAYPSTVSSTTIAVGPDSVPSSSEYISSVTRRVRWCGNGFLGCAFLTSFSSSNSNCELSPTYKASSNSASGRGKAWPIRLYKSVCMASMSSWRTRGRCASHVARNRLYVPVWVSDCKSTVFYRTPAPIIVYYFLYITCLLYLLFLIKHVRTSG